MLQYKVTVEPNGDNRPGAFVELNIGGDGWIDFDGWTPGGAEVYEINSEYRIDRQLDSAEGVIEYELTNE